MKVGIIIIVALIVSAFGLHFLLADPGQVIIRWQGNIYEMNVTVLAGLVILLFLLVWFIRFLIVAPRRLGEAAGRYRSARSGER